MFLARDFIITKEGLIFAVTLNGTEEGRVISCLRYVPHPGGLHKIDNEEAIELLRQAYPHYLHYSKSRDVELQAVPPERIARHLQPRRKLSELLRASPPTTPLQQRLQRLVQLLQDQGVPGWQLGVTGSLLAGTQHPESDIDLVVYGRQAFDKARQAVRQLIASQQLQSPSLALWETTWRRRGCDLSFADYLWHEQRKFNKGAIDGTKFDLVLVEEKFEEQDTRDWHKDGLTTIRAMVSDASEAFSMPARYQLDHHEISHVLSFTATYVGQAKTGEEVEIAGFIEHSPEGEHRIIVGSSRESPGQYIKVIHR